MIMAINPCFGSWLMSQPGRSTTRAIVSERNMVLLELLGKLELITITMNIHRGGPAVKLATRLHVRSHAEMFMARQFPIHPEAIHLPRVLPFFMCQGTGCKYSTQG
jgi:hypothetical protein